MSLKAFGSLGVKDLFQALAGTFEGLRVLINSQEPASRQARLEDSFAVAPFANGAVYVYPSPLHHQILDRFAEKHRTV